MNAWLRRRLQKPLDGWERFRNDALTIRAGDPFARRFAAFGAGSSIVAPRLLLLNPGGIALGERVEIRSHVCIEALGPPGKVLIEIGSGSIIGHYVRFVSVNGIVLEERCGIGHAVTITDSIHDWESAPEGTPPWDTGFVLGRPLRIETGAWIGNNSVVAGSLTIGARAIVAPNSVVTRDVPADTLVSGNPARRVPYPRRAAGDDGDAGAS